MPVLTSVLKIIERHSEMVEPVSFAEPVCRDADDDRFVETAIAASAGYLSRRRPPVREIVRNLPGP